MKRSSWRPFASVLSVLLVAGLFEVGWAGAAAGTSSQSSTSTLGPCDAGWVAPTPTAVAVTSVPIQVASTSGDYFVLYVNRTLRDGTSADIAVSVTLGQPGTTTLSDNLAALDAGDYRVEKYQVASPADIDGDCIDDITELNDLGNLNPMNPASTMPVNRGRTAIDSHETFRQLSYQGKEVLIDTHLRNLEYVKFWLLRPAGGEPEIYFMNTNTHRSHINFAFALPLPYQKRAGAMRGEIVFHPNVVAPDGSLGTYRFAYQPYDRYTFEDVAYSYELLAAAMPALDNNLMYYPMPDNVDLYQKEKAKYDASRVNVLLQKDVMPDVEYTMLNEAEGYGLLREIEPGETPGPRDVAILTQLPNDLPRVAGIITTVPQTPLSHVNLRAIQNKVPNAFIRDALDDDDIDDLIDTHVYYKATASGYTLRAATKAEVDAHHATSRPANAQIPERDLTVQTIASLDDIDFDDWNAFGVKAANVAELSGLTTLASGVAPDGFAIPFYFYDEFMKQATVSEKTLLGKKKWPDDEKITLAAGTTLANAVTQMLAHTKFQADYEIQEEMLDDLRDAIEDATTPQFIVDALVAMHAKYPDGQSLRYRSSTNNEDLPNFNGAGLYDSKTQDPDETLKDGIDKSIKGVWASLWNFRAFLEREHHRVDHTATAMGVLVHPNYSDERANGVAVSFDPITELDDMYYVNTQLGEDLVTNPEANSVPEQLLLDSTGTATVLARSNLAEGDKLFMTDAQMVQLRSSLKIIHDHFATLYGVADGDDFAMEIEFKITSANKLAIKQARPWVFAPPLSLTASVQLAFEVAEVPEGTPLSLTVARIGGILADPLTVDLTWSESGAMLAGTPPTSVTLAANTTSATVTLATTDDNTPEPDSVVTATIGASSDYEAGGTGTATATVTDDDRSTVKIRPPQIALSEGDSFVFALTRTGGDMTKELIVDVAVSESGAMLDGTPPTSVTFRANASTAVLTVDTIDDDTSEPDSVITATVVPRDRYGIAGPGKAVVWVAEDDSPVSVDACVMELAGDVSLAHVWIDSCASAQGQGRYARYYLFSLASTSTVQIDLESSTVDAYLRLRRGANKKSGSTVTFDDDSGTGKNARIIRKLAAGDYTIEATTYYQAETGPFVLTLTGAGQPKQSSTEPEVSITSGSAVVEGHSAVFTVTADPAPSSALTADVTVSSSGDFGASTGPRQVTIPTSGSATLSVATSDDSVDEADGSVTVTVNSGSGYTVSSAAGAATVAVSDDDEGCAPNLPSDAVTVSEVTGWRDAHDDDSAHVLRWNRVLTALGTDTGETAMTVAESQANEDQFMASRWDRVTRTLQALEACNNPPVEPEVSITAGSGVTEGGDAVFTVAASPAPSAALLVDVTVAQSGDFGASTGSHQVTVPTSGSTTLTVSTTNDDVDEPDGSVTVTVDDGSGYTVSSVAGSATVAVADDDDPPPPVCTVQLPSDAVTVSEVTGWRDAHDHDSAHVLRWNRVLTALGVDTGETAMTVAESRGNEGQFMLSRWDRVTRTLEAHALCNNPSPPPPPPPPPVVEPEVSVTAGSGVIEGGDAVFTVTADPAPSAALTVDVTVTQSGDFGAATGSRQVTIPTSGSATLTVATTGDSVDEVDGSVTVTVNNGSGYTVSATQGSAAVAVSDDDDPVPPPPPPVVEPEVSVTAGSDVTEGGDAVFTVTASPAPSAALAVDVTVTQSGDFGATTGSRQVTIPTTGTATLTVATTNDTTDEADGSVTTTINTGTGYTISATAGSATVAVADDDDPPPPPPISKPSISVGDATAGEGDGAAGFTVELSAASAGTVTVYYSVFGGTATAYDDYRPAWSSVTFAPGETSKTVQVSIIDDRTPGEGTETVTLRLSLFDATHATMGDSQATLTITDND